MTDKSASDTSLVSRGKTDPTGSRDAGQTVVERQQSVVSGVPSGAVPRISTARNPFPFSREKTGNSPRFLVIGRKDQGNFDKVSPFLISKQLHGLIGSLKNIKKIKDGLLIETATEAQSKRIQQIERLGEYEIDVKPHKTLNFSKGVVTCKDFLNCTVDEILNELTDEGVIEVRRMIRRNNGEIIETANHILTFNKPKLPSTIKAAFYVLPVRPFIPSPIKCFRCFQYGHMSLSCSKPEMCECGKPLHPTESCNAPPCCINCGGEHSARSNSCPKLKEEISIQNIRVLDRLSYGEAKRKYQSSMPSNKTYSQAAASTTLINSSEIKKIVETMLPNIERIIENQVEKSMIAITKQTRPELLMPPPNNFPYRETYRDSIGPESVTMSDTASQYSEKRKRTERYYEEDVVYSDESSTSQPDIPSQSKKKKKGWPKGKPRKPPEDENEIMQT